MDLKSIFAVVLFTLGVFTLRGQTRIYYQGFENANPTCPENWGYTGGNRTNETAKVGSYSCRVGRLGESNSLTMNTIDLTGLTNVSLQISHAVRSGSGPGMDTREGAVFLVSINGGAFSSIGKVSGYGDMNWAWTSSSGGATNASSGCNAYQAPNPLNYSVPAGTTSLAIKVISVGRSSSTCTQFNADMTSFTASNFDRNDEGIFLDEIAVFANAPTVSNNAPVCVGDTLMLYTQNAAPTYSFSWTGPLSFTSTQQNPIVSTTASVQMAGTYSNSILINGCSVQTLTTTVQIATPTVNTSSITACGSYTWPLNGQTYSTSGMYQINNGCTIDELNLTINQPVSATTTIQACDTYTWPVNNQTYTSSGTYTEINGCNQQILQLTINTTPQISLNDTAACQNYAITLSPHLSSTGGTYLWSNNQTTSSITVNPASSTSYALTYTLNACSSSASALVSITANPQVNLSPASVCSGQSITLNGTVSPAGGNYIWSNGQTSSSITVSPFSQTSYTLTYSVNGCTSNASSLVSVFPVPQINVNNVTICPGQSATLTSTTTLMGGTYAWSNSTSTNPSLTYTPIQSEAISVTQTVNGCTSNVATAQITIQNTPVLDFTADKLSGCSPLTVELQCITPNAGNVSWNINGATFTGNQASIVLNQPNCFDITMNADVSGCAGTLTKDSYVCVYPNPIASFSYSPNVLTQANETVQFSNTSIDGATFIWQFGDGNVSEEFSPAHAYSNLSSSTSVTLIATSASGCSASTTELLNFDDQPVYYIPNTFTPDGDGFNELFLPVFTSGFDPYNYHLSIFNRWGELVFESYNPKIGWDGSFGLRGLDAPVNTYSYKIEFKRVNTDQRYTLSGHINLLR